MEAKKLITPSFESSPQIDSYSQIYLEQYWPKVPNSAVGWSDNVLLMLAYQEAALTIKKHFQGNSFKLLDLSTGPALAPLLAMHSCISEVQLSDYYENNRISLSSMPITYWHHYVPMLIKLHDRPDIHIDEILADLDRLRSQHTPVAIDLFKEKPLPAHIDPFQFDTVSMHFVADGITETLPEYFRCLGKATDMVRPNGSFVMSAIVDSTMWQLGSYHQPSPNVSEKIILDFLSSQGISVQYLTRSIRHEGLTFDGGWIVLAGVKNKK